MLVESLASDIIATNEPKRVECGAPDFVVSRRREHGPLTVGYIEAKDVGKNLAGIERDSERINPTTENGQQLRRYRNALENLILTDYLEFRWYVRGELRETARLGTLGEGHKLVEGRSGGTAVREVLDDFLAYRAEPVASPRELAERLARLTHLIRDVIVRTFETNLASDTLRDLRRAFAEVLIPDLSAEQFADMFAQTLAYGLFAARVQHPPGRGRFRRLAAAGEIPKTNPFLRRLFGAITGPDLDDEPYAGLVDDLAQLLADIDIDAVLADFGTRTRQKDPVVHFYETFLAAYDPKIREVRGVYYTPEPVVSYIVRSVDHLLRTRFGLADGLADTSKTRFTAPGDDGTPREQSTHRVLILDPACGTGTFLYAVVDLIREKFRKLGNVGQWSAYVRDHLLQRLFGFEVLMAPYAVAHLKLGMQLAAQDLPEEQRHLWAYDFATDERLGVYLTNTLEEAEKRSELLFGRYISDEANAAARIKRDLPIMVIVGNPPYSVASYNHSEWIDKLMEDYKRTVRREESQIQALSNDYIKFIRFSQWRIDRTSKGVLGLITGHGYIDGPQARDMRASLMASFDEIHILNLHGSVRRAAAAATGKQDEPVFAIQQGTAIIIAAKGGSGDKGVRYAEFVGPLQQKFDYLSSNDIDTTKWTELDPSPPFYYFTPRSIELETEYSCFASITDIFGTGDRHRDKERLWATGFASQQDQFAIAFTDEELVERINKLIRSKSREDAEQYFRLCSTNQWEYDRAKRELSVCNWKERIADCAFRPFDIRRTIFDRNVVSILRDNVMQQLGFPGNLALLTSRVVNDASYAHAFVCRRPADKIFLSTRTSTNAYVFPLYLYDHTPLEQKAGTRPGRHPNLARAFLTSLADRLGLKFVPEGRGDRVKTYGPEDVLAYVYAILHSPTYRDRYRESLVGDFPRVPFPSDASLFLRLADLGSELMALHLMESPALDDFDTRVRYPQGGSNEVEPGHPHYLAPSEPDPRTGESVAAGRVYISRNEPKTGRHGQYFDGIPPEVWEFRIGGYQVCEKWLKDRRGRTLSYDDQAHYKRIVVAIEGTIRLMQEIDAAIPSWPPE